MPRLTSLSGAQVAVLFDDPLGIGGTRRPAVTTNTVRALTSAWTLLVGEDPRRAATIQPWRSLCQPTHSAFQLDAQCPGGARMTTDGDCRHGGGTESWRMFRDGRARRFGRLRSPADALRSPTLCKQERAKRQNPCRARWRHKPPLRLGLQIRLAARLVLERGVTFSRLEPEDAQLLHRLVRLAAPPSLATACRQSQFARTHKPKIAKKRVNGSEYGT